MIVYFFLSTSCRPLLTLILSILLLLSHWFSHTHTLYLTCTFSFTYTLTLTLTLFLFHSLIFSFYHPSHSYSTVYKQAWCWSMICLTSFLSLYLSILSYSFLSYSILSYSILYYTIRSYPILSYPIPFNCISLFIHYWFSFKYFYR